MSSLRHLRPTLRSSLHSFGVAAGLAIAALFAVESTAVASNYDLDEIPQAIPAAEAARLKAAGVTTTFSLLEKGADPAGRKALARSTKIPEKTLLGWVQMADLMRIRGVGPEVAKLLTAAGASTVAQLKTQDPAQLSDAIAKANSKLNLTQKLPTAENLAGWIEQAKGLPIVLK